MSLTVKRWLTQAKGLVNPLDAELILSNVIKAADRSFLVTHGSSVLTDKERRTADRMLGLRAQHVPLAYITGEKWFFGHKFKVTPDVLVPRPETELMVKITIGLYNLILKHKIETFDQVIKEKFGAIEPSWPDNPTIKEEYDKLRNEILSPVLIFDVGTGSGCAAISVALDCKNAEVLGLDISKEALCVAITNKNHYKLTNLEYMTSDLLNRINDPASVPDIIMANLPYVDRNWEWRSPEIEFEPSIALFADKGGLALIYKLIRQIHAKWPKLFEEKTKHHKYLLIESDMSQQEKIIRYAKRYGFKYVDKCDLITFFEY